VASPDLRVPSDDDACGTANVEHLLAVIAPEAAGDDRFVIDVSAHVEGHLFGGLVAAQALHAAYTSVAPGRKAQSAHAYFLRRGRPELPIEFEVHRDTDGRSFSARRVVAIQEGLPIFTMVCSFHVPEETLEILQPMPDDLTPPTSWPLNTNHDLDGCFEVRHPLVDPDEPPDRRLPAHLWVRVAGTLPDDPMLHDCLLFYVSDMGTPWNVQTPPRMQVLASLDHAVWLHRPTRMDEWHHLDLRTGALADARAFYTGRMWRADGTHVASIAQENLMRPRTA
jgi:acyl-CoA thioesterase-2